MLGLDACDEAQVGLLALGVRGPLQPRTVVRLATLRGSPLARADQVVIELGFSDGTTEAVAAARLRVRRDGARLWCALDSGRELALLDEPCASALLALVSSGVA
jgi:hypothetical protein